MHDDAELYRLARDGALLIVPNLRAVRQVRTRLASLATGDDAFDPDQVVHWRGWTHLLWDRALLHGASERILLQPLQERLLWEQTIVADDSNKPTAPLLDLCLSASSLVHRYNATADLARIASDAGEEDPVCFARWFRNVERECARQALLPAAAVEGELACLIRNGSIPDLPEAIVLCGMPELEPAQRLLLDVVAARGARVLEAPQPQNPVALALTLQECSDPAHELQTLNRFLAEVLDAPVRPSVAVVVPDLSTSRERIERALRERFPSRDPFHEDRQPLWEFSTSRPLASAAIAADALLLLRWTVEERSGSELASLLLSPYLAWPLSADEAALVDANVLRQNVHVSATWTPRRVAFRLNESSPALATHLSECTAGWHSLRSGAQSFTRFAARARGILREFGWYGGMPGQRSRTSQEFQAAQRFSACLDTLEALDLIAPPTSWSDFLERLAAHVRDTPFALENTAAPVQFLTPEESTGVQADALWFAHADEDHWNSAQRTHPLLPWTLQARHGMPGTDPLRDEGRFRERSRRLLAIAPAVTFSYACQGREGELRPSVWVRNLPGLRPGPAETGGTLDQMQAAAALEEYTPGASVPLVVDPAADSVRGGVRVLQNQAACAFRAFAETRLAARAPDTSDLGLDMRDRGSLLHRALQLFWTDTKDSTRLRALLQQGRLDDAILHAVRHATQHQSDLNDRWTHTYLEIQQERLVTLLRSWLVQEAERPDFTVIALEEEEIAQVGPLPLRVRVDRIDEVTLPGGEKRRVILDYKTGLQSTKKWEGEYPDEPQLPLYATLAAERSGAEASPVGAIAFGVVRAGQSMDFVSMPPKTFLLSQAPKAKDESLEGRLHEWRSTLQTLAEDYAAGTATVRPKDYPATCVYCEQRLLCRLDPELLDDTAGDEA